MTFPVRGAVPADEPALARIAHDAWTPDGSVLARPDRDGPFFRDPAGPENVLVAENSGEPVGSARLVPGPEVQPKCPAAVQHVQEIWSLSVVPEHQGRGAGTALLRAVRHEALARAARRITLRVLSTNPRARDLYLAHGYAVEGVLRGEFFLQGRYVDDVLMALDLT